MPNYANRYQLTEAWSKAADGWLAPAKDPKLNREVLLWRTVVFSDVEKEELLRRLGAAARFSHSRFMHILDVSVAGTEVYAVLTKKEGVRLAERIHALGWSGTAILEHLRELVPAIRDAKRERLPDFSITVDNLWLDPAGKLQFIQYWLPAPEKERDVYGFATLLYQLCSGGTVGPASMREFQLSVGQRLDSLPGGGAQDAVDWASSAFLPSSSLRRMEEGMDRLLAPRGPAREEQVPPVPAKRNPKAQQETPKQQPAATIRRQEETLEEEEENSPKSRLKPWIWFSAVVMLIGFLGVLGIWFVTRPPSSEPAASSQAAGSQPSIAASPSSTGSSSGAAGSTKPSGAASATPSSSPRTSPSPGGATASKPPAATTDGPVAVPVLTGKTLDEASKAALEAGLKYEYFLETGDTEKNRVIRQDPAAGTQAAKGDKVVFWVSKGKQ